jgi:hypothetical protein
VKSLDDCGDPPKAGTLSGELLRQGLPNATHAWTDRRQRPHMKGTMTTPKHLFAQTRKTPNNAMLLTRLHHYAGVPGSQSRLRLITLFGVGGLVVLNGADVVTTHLLLSHGAVEANPLSSVLLASASLLWVKLAILGALGVMVIRHRPRFGVTAFVFVALGMYATAVLSNLLILNIVMR